MRFINILVGIVLPVTALTAWLWYGYQKTNQANAAEGIELVTFDKYVIAWLGELNSDGGSELAGGDPGDLEALLPKAGADWTQRKVKDNDVAALRVSGLDAARQALLLDPASEDAGEGLVQARSAWDTPDGVLIAELVRYPDALLQQHGGDTVFARNRMPFGKVGNQAFANIAGLEIREAILLPQIPARVFRADLDGQIVLRVSAPKRMSDDALLTFFSGLKVAALNAGLQAPLTGMGALQSDGKPLAVLDARMSDAERALIGEAMEGFGMERAQIQAAREVVWAGLSAEPMTEEGSATEVAAEAELPGVNVRRGVNKDDPGRSTLKTGSGTGTGMQEDCKTVGGRKVCGVAAPQAE